VSGPQRPPTLDGAHSEGAEEDTAISARPGANKMISVKGGRGGVRTAAPAHHRTVPGAKQKQHSPGQDAWLTVLMLKSGTRSVGIEVRVK
jgi:hypothetical protein